MGVSFNQKNITSYLNLMRRDFYMWNTFKIMALIIGMLFVSCQFALAKQPLPDGLDEILEEMSELEESYEEGNWLKAQQSVGKINLELKELFEKTENGNLEEDKKMMSRDIYLLKAYVLEENTEKTEGQYIKFQKRFFNFINNFDYEIHPVFSMIDKYINEEATEAAAKMDFDDVVSEMREVGNLLKLAQPLLKEKGYTDEEIADFRLKIAAVIKAGKAKDANLVNEKLKEVQEAYKSIMALFT
jgi:hypothetical protein